MERTSTSKTKTGNWLIETTCDKGHTTYKNQMDTTGAYKCAYCGLHVT